jgi:hypothetical protein
VQRPRRERIPVRRVVARHLRGQLAEPGARRLERHAVAQAAERQQVVAVAIGRIRHDAERDPHVEPPHFREPGRRHADDGVGLAVDLRIRSQHRRRRLVAAPPQRLADHRDAVAAALVLRIQEVSARHRRRAHHPEERGRRGGARRALGSLRPGNGHAARRPRPEVGEHALVLAPIEIALVGGRPVGQRRQLAAPHLDQPVRIREGQRLEHHGVDHREERGGGADAERQREHGGDGEPGGPQQETETKAKIAQRIHDGGLDVTFP